MCEDIFERRSGPAMIRWCEVFQSNSRKNTITKRKKHLEPKRTLRDRTFSKDPQVYTKFSSHPNADFHETVYPWNEASPKYGRELFPQKNGAKRGMANIVPVFLSMSLLANQDFSAFAGTDSLSRELLPPHLPMSTSLEFPSQAGDSRNSMQHESFLQDTISNPPSEGSIPEYGSSSDHTNILQASTPRTNERYSKPYADEVFLRSIGRPLDNSKIDPHSVNRLDYHGFKYGFSQGHVPDDYIGPAMELVYAWSTVDFEFESIDARDTAIFEGEYIAENNLPLGLEIWRDKVFITLPKWKDGVPATLATVPRNSKTRSPKLRPYPNWEWHRTENCDGPTSVFRVQVDECDRLWVLDSGVTDVSKTRKRSCPPAIFIFDLRSDTLIKKYTFPDKLVKEDSLYTNIVVDIRNKDCGSARAYMSDVFRYGIVVYDFFKDSAFRVEHPYFLPDPLSSRYQLHGLNFYWSDGIFAMALSPVDINGDRTLFFHSLSSFREFAVPTSVLTDEKKAEMNMEKFTPVGRPRATDYGHSSGSTIARNGVMFFNMATRDSVWCWDTRKEYIPQNLGVVGISNVSLVFPNDIKVDHEEEQSVWLISNRLPLYLYSGLDSGKINYRVFKANVREAVADTVCDPNYVVPESERVYDEAR